MSENKYHTNNDSQRLNSEGAAQKPADLHVPKHFYKNLLLLAGGGLGIAALVVWLIIGSIASFNKKKVVNKPLPQPVNINVAASLFAHQASCIHPPMPGLEAKFEDFTVNARQGGTFHCKTGSAIEVKPMSFINVKGQPLSGVITLRFREFHDMIYAFLSGIPMVYDSGGHSYDFQTGGMFDIRGYQNGEPVAIAPGKTIIVNLNCRRPAGNFNLYHLDTMSGNWTYLGPDRSGQPELPKETLTAQLNAGPDITSNTNTSSPSVSQPLDTSFKGTQNSIDSINRLLQQSQNNTPVIEVPVKPYPPKKASGFLDVFKCRVNTNEFPELAHYKQIRFEEINSRSLLNPRPVYMLRHRAYMAWDNDKNSYYLRYANKWYMEHPENWVYMQPVFLGWNYNIARKIYNRTMKRYNNALRQKNIADSIRAEFAARMENLKETYQVKYKKQVNDIIAYQNVKDEMLREAFHKDALANNMTDAEWKNELESRKKQAAENADRVANSSLNTGEISTAFKGYGVVFRKIEIARLGVTNCDAPTYFRPPIEQLSVSFKDKNGKPIAMAHTFLVDKTKQFIHTFYTKNDGIDLTYMPNDKNIIFGVMPGNKIAICRNNALADLPGQDNAEIIMEYSEKQFKSADALRNYLLLW